MGGDVGILQKKMELTITGFYRDYGVYLGVFIILMAAIRIH